LGNFSPEREDSLIGVLGMGEDFWGAFKRGVLLLLGETVYPRGNL